MTYDGLSYFYYLNGQKLRGNHEVIGQIVRRNTSLTIGQSGRGIIPGDQEHFFGYIDELRIYRRALSDAEVKALYDRYVFERIGQ